jgi:hypothetical protein
MKVDVMKKPLSWMPFSLLIFSLNGCLYDTGQDLGCGQCAARPWLLILLSQATAAFWHVIIM